MRTDKSSFIVDRERLKCCICGDEIEVTAFGWSQGNNAEPVVLNGRCCDDCNLTKVIPARLRGVRR